MRQEKKMEAKRTAAFKVSISSIDLSLFPSHRAALHLSNILALILGRCLRIQSGAKSLPSTTRRPSQRFLARLQVELLVPSSYLLLVVRPGAPSSILAPSSNALCY